MRQLKLKNLTWIDIVKPHNGDLDFLQKNFNFHSLILKEIKQPTYHPLFESYNTYLFWILHFPDWEKNSHITSQEIDFLITRNVIITIRYSNFKNFDEIWRNIEQNYSKMKLEITGHLFYQIVRKLLNNTFPEINHIKEIIDEMEDKIFIDPDEKAVIKVNDLKRTIIDFLKTFKPQQFVWENSQEEVLFFWGERFKPYLSDLVTDYRRILHLIDTYWAIAKTLNYSLEAIFNDRRNHVVEILTIFTAIILPLSLLTSLYGMNLAHLPFANHPFAFWGFIILMAVSSILALAYFRYKKWL